MSIISLVTPLNLEAFAQRIVASAASDQGSLHDYLTRQSIRFNRPETEHAFYRELFRLTLAQTPLRVTTAH